METMKKALSIFFLLLTLLAFKNIAYAQSELDACLNFNTAGDYKRAIEAGRLAIKKHPYNAYAYICLGDTYYDVGELKLAYENMKRALSLTNNIKTLMYIYNRIGMILDSMGYSDDALLNYSRSLSLAMDLGDTQMQAALLSNIGGIYHDKGELDKALSYLEKSLSLTTNEKRRAVIYTNIATLYDEKGDYQKAVEYFHKAIEISEEYGNYRGVSEIELNLGETYREMKDYENAEKYLSEGLEGAKEVGDKYWEATGYEYLGRLYEDKGDKKTAKENYKRAYILFKSIGAEKDAQYVLKEMKKLDKSN
ncbi:MAG: tetratricopeptide repeat protein [Candidatus Nanopusillus acidilobi]|jgi:tetratricopeptide (TPR) repeat protein